MSSLIGMDGGEVRRSASLLRRQSEGLGGVVATVDGIVHQIGQNWQGDGATAFIDAWFRQHRPRLERARQDLAGLAQSADANAAQQDRASSAGGSAAQSTFGLVNSPDAAAVARDERAIEQQTRARSQRGVVDWWNHLGPAQQRTYLATVPAFLASMPALRPYMRLYAQQPLRTVDDTNTLQAGGGVTVMKRHFDVTGGATTSVELATYPGGASVTLAGGAFASAAAGVGAGIARGTVSAGAEGDAGVTYRFANRSEAQAFYDKVLAGADGPGAVQKVAGNIAKVTAEEHLHPVSTQYAVTMRDGIDLKIGADGATASVGADTATTYLVDSTAHTQTLQYTVGAHGSAGMDIAGVSADGKLGVALVAGTGQHADLQRIVVSGQYAATGSVGGLGSVLAKGSGGSFSLSIDPNTDPGAVQGLVGALESGNPAAVHAQLDALVNQSTLVVQSDTSTSVTHSFDHPVNLLIFHGDVKGSDAITSTTFTGTWLKPAGCDTAMHMPD